MICSGYIKAWNSRPGAPTADEEEGSSEETSKSKDTGNIWLGTDKGKGDGWPWFVFSWDRGGERGEGRVREFGTPYVQ